MSVLQVKTHMQSWRVFAQQLLSPLPAHLVEPLVAQGGQQFWDLALKPCHESHLAMKRHCAITAATNQSCCPTAISDIFIISLACLSAWPILCGIRRHVMLPPRIAAYCSLVILRSAKSSRQPRLHCDNNLSCQLHVTGCCQGCMLHGALAQAQYYT